MFCQYPSKISRASSSPSFTQSMICKIIASLPPHVAKCSPSSVVSLFRFHFHVSLLLVAGWAPFFYIYISALADFYKSKHEIYLDNTLVKCDKGKKMWICQPQAQVKLHPGLLISHIFCSYCISDNNKHIYCLHNAAKNTRNMK